MRKSILPLTVLLLALALSVSGCSSSRDVSGYYQPPLTELVPPTPTPTPSLTPAPSSWSSYLGPLYEGSWAQYAIRGIDAYMREFTGTREVKVLDVTADTLVTEEVERVSIAGITSDVVRRAELTLVGGSEARVRVYTMYDGDAANVSVFECTASAAALGGDTLSGLLAGAQVSDLGVAYVYIPDLGKFTCQHTIRNITLGDAGRLVTNFTDERWAVSGGIVPLTGTVYGITTHDYGYGQKAVTVAQLRAFNLTGAQPALTADVLGQALQLPCPY